MSAVHFVVLIRTHGKSEFPVYTEHIAELEITPFILICTRFSYADKTAAFIHKLTQRTHYALILPVLCAAPCGISIAGIDDNFNCRVDSVSHFIKRNKLHINRHSAQALDNAYIRINFTIPERVMYLISHPPSQIAPAIQNADFKRRRISFCSLHIFMNLAEFIHYFANLLDKTGPFAGKLQVTAISNPV